MRCGFAPIHLQPGTDRFFVIVSAATSQHAVDHHVLGNLEVHHAVEGNACLGKEPVEDFGLFHGAGKPVEEETITSIILGQAFLHHAGGHIGGDQFAGVNIAFRFKPQGGAVTNVGTE